MTAVPTSPNWVSGEVISETKLDSISTVLDYLAAPPLAILGRSSNQSISASTYTAVEWNTETYDTVAGHSTVTNTSRYTAVYPGLYKVSAAVPFVANTEAYKLHCYFQHSTGTEYFGGALFKSTNATNPGVNGSAIIPLNVGEYMEVYVWHNKSGVSSIDSSYHGGPRWYIQWVSNL